MRAPSRAACHPSLPVPPLFSGDAEPENIGCTLPDGKFMPDHLPGSSLPLFIGKFLYPAQGPLGLKAVSENLDTRWLSK